MKEIFMTYIDNNELYNAFINSLLYKEIKTKEDYIAFRGAEFGARWQMSKLDEFAIEFGEWLEILANADSGTSEYDIYQKYDVTTLLQIYKKEKGL